jgi:hypothetical protein
MIMISDFLRNKALRELRKCQENRDYEAAHATADQVLCEVLILCGEYEVVDEFKKVRRECA